MATTTPTAKKPSRPRATAAKAPTPSRAAPAPKRGNGAATTAVAARTPAEAAKPPKVKLIRDSFTIPRDEYGAIDALKLRAAKLGRIAKKSELLRAGLKLLAASADAALLGALESVPALKTGRPKKKHHGRDSAAEADTAGT